MRKLITSLLLIVTMVASSASVFASNKVEGVNKANSLTVVETQVGRISNDSPKVVECITHKWGKWKVTKKATCKNQGRKVRVCSVCGKRETKVIPIAHTYVRKGNKILCTKCGNHLFNPAGGKLKTKLYKKKAYKLTDAQITALTKLFVMNFGHDRDNLEAGISATLNYVEKVYKGTSASKLLNNTKKILGFATDDWRLPESDMKISNMEYLITKYVVTKGYRVFPAKVNDFDWKGNLLYTKTVKVSGKTYKVATNSLGAKYVIYRTIDDVVYGYPVPAAVSKALSKK